MRIYNAGNRVMNTYLYRIKDGYVMIDTGYENSYQKCTSSMNRQGISWDDVKYILLTHAHDDHAGFLKEVLDKHANITCILSDKAFPVLARGQNSFNGGCSSSRRYIVWQDTIYARTYGRLHLLKGGQLDILRGCRHERSAKPAQDNDMDRG